MTETPTHSPERRVLPFRRSGSPLAGGSPRPSPVQNLERFEHADDGEDDYRHRMIMNGLALLVLIVLVGSGIWIANTMAELRKNQDCVLSGRKNCNPPVNVPAAPLE